MRNTAKTLLFVGLIAAMIMPFNLVHAESEINSEPCYKKLINCNYNPENGWSYSNNIIPLELGKIIDSDTKPTIKTYNKHHYKYDFAASLDHNTTEYPVAQKIKKPHSVFESISLIHLFY